MEAIEELNGPKDHTHIVKGKRTKRQRPQSPIPFTITANSSSGDGGGYGSNGDIINNNNHHLNHETNSSPATSGEFMDSAAATEEEEDMANCLILLAQGGRSREPSNPKEDEEAGTYKFTSKRYLEAPSSGNGKVGIFVYQCKTCSRTFPSFQALGGHRASHKKPKVVVATTAAVEERKRPVVLSDEEEPLSLQLSNKGFYGSATKFKVHECSICGAEFSSGQALGGHMRRHRGPTGANTTLSLSPTSPPIVLEAEEANKARNVLSLDLNLPAPEDDHLRDSRDSKVVLSSKQQQQPPLVFPATPALVDCQY